MNIFLAVAFIICGRALVVGANAKNANTEEGHINQRCKGGYFGRDSRAPELEEKRKIDISSTDYDFGMS